MPSRNPLVQLIFLYSTESVSMKQSQSLSVFYNIIIQFIFQRRSKKMKLSQSLPTETTKQSQLKIPLLQTNPQTLPTQVTVFTERNGKKYKLLLPLESRSIADLILEATKHFNVNFELKLRTDASCYFLYAARKNGKACSDYPALEPSQDIVLTKLTYYYLKDKTASIERARIQSNFACEKKVEIKTKERSFCPCFFGI